MDETPLSRRTVGFSLALSAAVLLNAIIVVVKEKSDAVMALFKSLTGHHWITHSVIVLVAFLGLGWSLARRSTTIATDRLIVTVLSSVAIATAIIAGFYLFVD